MIPRLPRPAGGSAHARGVAAALASGERGTTMVEYAPILAMIALVVVVVLTPLGTAVVNLLTPVVQAF